MADKKKWPWAPRSKKETLAGKVERLRIISGDEDENNESDDLTNEICADNDPAAISLLLLMRTAEDDPDISDEKEYIVNCMRNWEPQGVYMDELVKIVGAMCRKAPPELLRLVLDDIAVGPDSRTELFLTRLPRLSPKDRQSLIAFIEQSRKPDDLYFIRARYEAILNRLRDPKGKSPLNLKAAHAIELLKDIGELSRTKDETDATRVKEKLDRLLSEDAFADVFLDGLTKLSAKDRANVAAFIARTRSPNESKPLAKRYATALEKLSGTVP